MDTVEALIPLVGANIKSLDGLAAVIKKLRFFLKRQPRNQIVYTGFHRLSNVEIGRLLSRIVSDHIGNKIGDRN